MFSVKIPKNDPDIDPVIGTVVDAAEAENRIVPECAPHNVPLTLFEIPSPHREPDKAPSAEPVNPKTTVPVKTFPAGITNVSSPVYWSLCEAVTK